MPTREEMLKEGYKYYCMECRKVFRELPTMDHETGHGFARQIPCCPRDGCDLICHLSDDRLVKVE